MNFMRFAAVGHQSDCFNVCKDIFLEEKLCNFNRIGKVYQLCFE